MEDHAKSVKARAGPIPRAAFYTRQVPIMGANPNQNAELRTLLFRPPRHYVQPITTAAKQLSASLFFNASCQQLAY
jgi:hypothetical protein